MSRANAQCRAPGRPGLRLGIPELVEQGPQPDGGVDVVEPLRVKSQKPRGVALSAAFLEVVRNGGRVSLLKSRAVHQGKRIPSLWLQTRR